MFLFVFTECFNLLFVKTKQNIIIKVHFHVINVKGTKLRYNIVKYEEDPVKLVTRIFKAHNI